MAWQGTVTYRDATGEHTVIAGFPDEDLGTADEVAAWFAEHTPVFVPGGEFVTADLTYVSSEDYAPRSYRRHRGRHRP